MRPWIVPQPRAEAVVPDVVETVFVLSRVTLGADIKITSMVLDAMKRRFPQARIALVGDAKSAELFAADPRIEHVEARYPRSGPVSARVLFAEKLKIQLARDHRIVIDPDSRMTQLGLLPVCEPQSYFHFPSRTAGGDSLDNLTELTAAWLVKTFGVSGDAYIAPKPITLIASGPTAAINLGVGDNESKRIGGDFERDLIQALCRKYPNVWLDRGAGGSEAARVTAAAEGLPVQFWEGSFAGFASIVAQSDFYVGYDSGGQHAAAAAGTPLVSIFAGACSERFRHRWAPMGPAQCRILTPPFDASEIF